jgi:hypothetical protein
MKKKKRQYHNSLFSHMMKVTNLELIEFQPFEFNKFVHLRPIHDEDILSVDMDQLIKELQDGS